MRNKAIFSFIILLTLFLSISAISASENVTADNLASDDDLNEVSSIEGNLSEVSSAEDNLNEAYLVEGNLSEVSSADEDSKEVLSSDDNLEKVTSVNNAVTNSSKAKSSTTISAKYKVSYVDYKDTFTIKLTSGGKALAKKHVTVTLNNVKYNKITNSKGQVTIKFKLKTGKYKVRYSFAGDDKFAASNGASKINVKPNLKTFIKLIDRSKKVHCEGVKSVFRIKLKDVHYKPVSGKKVKIKVKNKIYKAITNKWGVAKFYINLKKGNNKIKYYFIKDGKYLTSSGKYKVKVKYKLDKGDGYWVNQWDMKNVNLKQLSKRGTKHIFLLHTAFDLHGKKDVKNWIKYAHKKGIKVHMWICAFYNGGYVLPCTSDGDFNYNQMNKVIKKCKYYASIKEIDGIHFDYTRFPGNAYQYKKGVDAVNYFIEKACNEIREVRPGIIISSAVMPEPNDMKYYYGQDVATMSKHLDVLVPMVYKGNYEAGDNWIKQTTKAFVKSSKGALIWAGLQSYRSDSDISELSYGELFKDAQYAKKGGASGIIMFRWGLSALLKFYKL